MSVARSIAYPGDRAAIMASAGNRRVSSLTLSFDGSAREYFPIWIVNLFLTLVTLGLYSPWAKVRKMRYFYGSTQLAGSAFEYLADPRAILKGRLAAAALLAAYGAIGSVHPMAQPAFVVLLFLAMPWLVVSALRFRARNTAYRNIRFDFTACHRDAFKAYVLWPMAGVLTFGLLLPYAIYRQKTLCVENSSYGDSGFVLSADAWSFYSICLAAFAIVALGATGAMGALAVSGLHPYAAAAAIGVVCFFGYVYIKTKLTNLIFDNAIVNRTRFKSRLEFGALAQLYVTNLVAILASLGLLTPWAQIRLARYRAESLTVVPQSGIEHFCAERRRLDFAL